jgi:transcriptional regulator with XRE-family HTH domain
MDWKKLIAELTEAGVTQEQIAQHCGVSQSSVSDLGRGATKSPRWEFASKLQALHAEKVGPRTANAPVPTPTPQTEHAQASDNDPIGDTALAEARRLLAGGEDLAPAAAPLERRHPGSEAQHIFNKQRATDRPRAD